MTTLTYLVRKEPTTNGGDDCYIAWFPSIPNLKVQGATDDIAVAALLEMYPRYLNTMRQLGIELDVTRTDLTKPSWAFRPLVASTLTA